MAYFPTKVLDNQIKALPTVSTASGSIATFETDMTENLVEVECEIVYNQASGTPSPSNPLPILTFDHLDLFHNSINMWNEQWELGAYNINNGEKYNSSTQIRCKNKIPIQPNTRYFKALSGTGTIHWQIYFDKYGNYLSYDGITANTEFITPNNTYYMVFYCESNYGTTYNNDISINYPSTDTQYHAFNGAYIPFGQTVAKGTLNVSTGVLTVTHGVVDLGSLNWILVSGYSHHFNAVSGVNLKPNLTTGACSVFEIVYTSYAGMGNYTLRIESGTLTVRDDDYTTGTDLKTALNGQCLVSELDTPIKVQLSSTQIQALLNENNLWCDTGDTSVKFILSVGEYVNQNV